MQAGKGERSAAGGCCDSRCGLHTDARPAASPCPPTHSTVGTADGPTMHGSRPTVPPHGDVRTSGGLTGVEQVDLHWPDFVFNLVSMCIVYVYFSKATDRRENVAAVLLCLVVAAFDVVLLLMRWLWCAALQHRLHLPSAVDQVAEAAYVAR